MVLLNFISKHFKTNITVVHTISSFFNTQILTPKTKRGTMTLTLTRNNCSGDRNGHANTSECSFPIKFGVASISQSRIDAIDMLSPQAKRSMSIEDEMFLSDAISRIQQLRSFGSFDSTSSAFSVVPRTSRLRPISHQTPRSARTITTKGDKFSGSANVVRVPNIGRRPVAEFSFQETDGEIPDHLFFPVL